MHYTHLHQVRVDEEALLGAQLDAREEVRERQDRLLLPLLPLDSFGPTLLPLALASSLLLLPALRLWLGRGSRR